MRGKVSDTERQAITGHRTMAMTKQSDHQQIEEDTNSAGISSFSARLEIRKSPGKVKRLYVFVFAFHQATGRFSIKNVVATRYSTIIREWFYNKTKPHNRIQIWGTSIRDRSHSHLQLSGI
jgi:hypothetical protein